MGPRVQLTFLLVATGLALGACGDSESNPTQGQTADTALVRLDDLPPGTTVEEPLPEQCGPLQIFEKDADETGISKLFVLGTLQMEEAIGVFATPRLAAAAYDSLNSTQRSKCIRAALEGFSPTGTTIAPPRTQQLDLGNAGSRMRFLVNRPESPAPDIVDVVSIRADRCVASILFIAETSDSAPSEINGATRTAARLLTDACSP